jgi:ATP-dependent DNA helicase RecG
MYAARVEKLGIRKLENFLYHLPNRYEDYSIISPIAQAQAGETVTIQGKVIAFKNQYLRGNRFKTIQKATISDGTGEIELTWFNQPFIKTNLPEGSQVSASGRVEIFGKKISISNPDYELMKEGEPLLHTARLIPVYPETRGVSSKWLRRQIFQLLSLYPEPFSDYLPDNILKQQNFLPLDPAIRAIHYPTTLEAAQKARERLAFDELFLMQLAGLKRRHEWKQTQTSQALDNIKYKAEIETLIKSLPFTLTNAQQSAINDILVDTAKDKPMNRLVQGDVGSGKTIVAAISMYAAFLNGFQSVFIAPTEILAGQHYKSIEKLLTPLGLKIGLITGSKKIFSHSGKRSAARIKTAQDAGQASMTNGQLDILIGTHALLSEKIQFDNLALVIIDEQQRFGVEQRSVLRQKGQSTHVLTMTATPIPRTVALTMYGDLDVSYLNEMPRGRKQIKTWLVPPEKRDSAYEWIRKEIKTTDSQAFIICPFIEESESMTTIKAASKEFERLSKEIYPDLKVGLLHGKLKAKEKDAVLQDFKNRKYDILVATPVVEVGIDIPNATIIMIEASERFGLAGLHQLRGRVGRGDKQSYCLLFSETKSETTTQRLKAMETMHSGAELAELDLKLRGPGNMYGTAQHGVPQLKVASFSDFELIERAKNAAHKIYHDLAKYPKLTEKLNTISLENISPD